MRPTGSSGRGEGGLLTVAVALVTVAIAAACGGGSAGELTKDQWIARADAVCAALAEELQAVPEPRTPVEIGEAGRQVFEIASRRLAELRDLPPPAADAAAIDEMLDAFEKVVTVSRQFTEAIAAGDEEAAAELFPQLEHRSREAEGLAEAYGLHVCGKAAE
jgi:ABC-type Na+ efflux pump permease subunit